MQSANFTIWLASAWLVTPPLAAVLERWLGLDPQAAISAAAAIMVTERRSLGVGLDMGEVVARGRLHPCYAPASVRVRVTLL